MSISCSRKPARVGCGRRENAVVLLLSAETEDRQQPKKDKEQAVRIWDTEYSPRDKTRAGARANSVADRSWACSQQPQRCKKKEGV